MKLIHNTTLKKQASIAMALLSICSVAASRANAKHRDPNSPEPPAAVIAHLPMPGAAATQLILAERGPKHYLYIEQSSKEGFAVVDVTAPNQPNVVKREAWPDQASTGTLQMIGPGLALAQTSNDAAPEPASRTGTVMLLDLSDPANPRTIQTFPGVTSTVADGARGLVYLANNEGLWILRQKADPAASQRSRGCLSENASDEVAACE